MLASSSLRIGALLPGTFPVPIELIVCCFGTGNAESARLREPDPRPFPWFRSRLRAGLARYFGVGHHQPGSIGADVDLGAHLHGVNDIALPAREKSIVTILGLLMPMACSFQPCDFSAPR